MATKLKGVTDDKMLELVAEIGVKFKTFGGGVDVGGEFNPLIGMLKDRPLMFAMGVDVADVVRFVLERR